MPSTRPSLSTTRPPSERWLSRMSRRIRLSIFPPRMLCQGPPATDTIPRFATTPSSPRPRARTIWPTRAASLIVTRAGSGRLSLRRSTATSVVGSRPANCAETALPAAAITEMSSSASSASLAVTTTPGFQTNPLATKRPCNRMPTTACAAASARCSSCRDKARRELALGLFGHRRLRGLQSTKAVARSCCFQLPSWLGSISMRRRGNWRWPAVRREPPQVGGRGRPRSGARSHPAAPHASERAAPKHPALDVGQRGERVHLRARAARRVLAVDHEHRNSEASPRRRGSPRGCRTGPGRPYRARRREAGARPARKLHRAARDGFGREFQSQGR